MKGNRQKKWVALISLLAAFALLGGCGKEEPELIDYEAKEPVQEGQQPVERETEEAKEAEEEEPEPEESREGQKQSPITGLWMDEEKAGLRPYAIMINNIKVVNPQSGISEASILYEALVEGGITRLMGIFEDFSSDRIGSIRSARHYYASIADEYDAIFVHYGETKYATSKIAALGLNNLSGLESVGNTVYYRDSSIKAPHNAFASYKGILAGTKEKNYRTQRKEDYENHFMFYKEDTDLPGGEATKKVELGFSSYTTPYFEYNEKEKTYGRFQFGGAHVDANTGQQLQFKNIIVQLVKEWNIDKNGYQTMDIENSSGEGYYLTNGKRVPITWQKNESTKKMHYYDKEGNILQINPGKTFVAVYPFSRAEQLVFHAE